MNDERVSELMVRSTIVGGQRYINEVDLIRVLDDLGTKYAGRYSDIGDAFHAFATDLSRMGLDR
jgi:hypothetical protein